MHICSHHIGVQNVKKKEKMSQEKRNELSISAPVISSVLSNIIWGSDEVSLNNKGIRYTL